MSRSFRETHEARVALDPEYATEYARLTDDCMAKCTTALRNARIGLAMWSMATPDIDALIGPMNEEDREQARRCRGVPLWDEGSQTVQNGQSSA